MDLFEECARAQSTEGDPLQGFEPTRLLVLFEHLANQLNARFTSFEQPCSLRQTRDFQDGFCAHFGLSALQYQRLLELFESCGRPAVGAAYRDSHPEHVDGIRPTYCRRYFGVDAVHCCGKTMRVRYVIATVIEVSESYPAMHIVKECQGDCKSSWYLNKRTYRGEMDDPDGGPLDAQGLLFHEFYPFEGGETPLYTASKSGRTIMSLAYLTQVAAAQCTQRSVVSGGG